MGSRPNSTAAVGHTRLAAIWLIYAREMRDQLRDRRTLFTIAVLPILLYPLVGTLLLQMAQFSRQHPTSIGVVGSEHLAGVPRLINQTGADAVAFEPSLVENQDNLVVDTYTWKEIAETTSVVQQATHWVRGGTYDAVVLFPPTFAGETTPAGTDSNRVQLLYNVASDQSLVARGPRCAAAGFLSADSLRLVRASR